MATWPGSLPSIRLLGYSMSDALPYIETEMETGPIRRTRLTSYHMTRGNASLVLEGTTAADAFRALIASSNYGADWIDAVPLDTGTGVVNRRARISGTTWTVLVPGSIWTVNFSIETDDQDY